MQIFISRQICKAIYTTEEIQLATSTGEVKKSRQSMVVYFRDSEEERFVASIIYIV